MTLPEDIAALGSSLHSGGVADENAIAAADQALSWAVPDEYREFVRMNDGAEGFIGDTYVSLWRVAELAELNALARVAEFAPGFTAFGTDGGTELFGFDRRTATNPVVAIPVVGLSWEYGRPLGGSFEAFLRKLSGGPVQPERRVLGIRLGRKQAPTPNPELFGMNAWQIHPVILGGDPTDPKNRTIVPLREMLRFASFWNDQIAQVKGRPQTLSMDLDQLRKSKDKTS
jgi:hypothetical protein